MVNYGLNQQELMNDSEVYEVTAGGRWYVIVYSSIYISQPLNQTLPLAKNYKEHILSLLWS